MRIALASDHAGFKLKKGIIEHLLQKNHECEDFGCHSTERTDYMDFAVKAIQGYNSGGFERIILICGTGIGMSLVANRFKGIRATLCCNEYMAEMSRKHNDSNCLTMGGRTIPLDEAILIVDTWLEVEFEGGRHQKRLNKLAQIEENNFKP